MISVIICSINKIFAEQVQKNIADTIGVVWEPVVIDNTELPRSITSIYNSGAAKAKYNILCFVHEDVLFTTQNWGEKVVDHFNNDPGLGLLGIAGSKYKSRTPSGWFTGQVEFDCCNITHINTSGQQDRIYYNPAAGSKSQNVIVLDGVFLCSPKAIWQEFKYDDTLLKDFHLYDLDFSFRIAAKYRVIVSFEIDLLHITKGMHYGNRWLESTLLWHKKMQQQLPFFLPEFNGKKNKIENNILKLWLIRLKHENLSFYNKMAWLYKIKIWKQIPAWPFVFLFLFKSLFNRR